MNKQAGGWGFLTHHTRVLLAVARAPATRMRDIAAACHITERTVQGIVTDLELAGCLSRQRHGRRAHYTGHPDDTLRHPAEAHLPNRTLLETLRTPQAQPDHQA
ncbi:MarR family transcriptional regulator [Streptomyces sp. NPDC050759]|uniref:MarR family transcriptional regulator n=1 Tax=Streptomyces sp. NPDC050759 TaxID=3365635 RepID=UPI003787E380